MISLSSNSTAMDLLPPNNLLDYIPLWTNVTMKLGKGCNLASRKGQGLGIQFARDYIPELLSSFFVAGNDLEVLFFDNNLWGSWN